MSNLFGTDGIRGRVSLDECDDEGALQRIVDERLLTPQLMKLLGEALGRCLPVEGEGSQVVIGWDDRPFNATLAAWLTLGFHASNTLIPESSTGLWLAVIIQPSRELVSRTP